MTRQTLLPQGKFPYQGDSRGDVSYRHPKDSQTKNKPGAALPPGPKEPGLRAEDWMKINKAINVICDLTKIDHQSAWNTMYAELRRRCHFDAAARLKFVKGKKSKLDIVIEADYGEKFYAIIYERLQLIQKSLAS